jgi:hypothetical protein
MHWAATPRHRGSHLECLPRGESTGTIFYDNDATRTQEGNNMDQPASHRRWTGHN